MIDPDVVKRLSRRLPSRAERRVTFALKVLLLIAAAIYLLVGVLNFFGAIRTTGLLAVGALFLAYLIYPLVRRLNVHLPVIWSIVVVYAFIALVGAFAVTLVAPQIGRDVTSFGHALPGLMSEFQLELINPHSAFIARVPLDDRLYLANLPSQFDTLAKQYGLDTLQKACRCCSRQRRSVPPSSSSRSSPPTCSSMRATCGARFSASFRPGGGRKCITSSTSSTA